MNRVEELNDDFVDLGVASVETKGALPVTNEFQGTIPTGLLTE